MKAENGEVFEDILKYVLFYKIRSTGISFPPFSRDKFESVRIQLPVREEIGPMFLQAPFLFQSHGGGVGGRNE